MPGAPQQRTGVINAEVLRHCLSHPARGRRWTIRELAAHVNATPARIGHLTSGRNTTLPVNLAAHIAEAIGVPPQVLFVPWLSSESDTEEQQ